MTDSSIDPLKEAQADAEKLLRIARHKALDLLKKYLTASLIKAVGAGAISIGLLIAAFPWFVGATAGLALGGLMVFAIYATRLIKRMDSDRRWTWIGQQRQQQQNLKLEQDRDRAVLAQLGDRNELARIRPVELRTAVMHLRSTYHSDAAAQQNPKAPRRPVTPPPDISPLKRRMQTRDAEIKEAEARIQTYADPDNVASAMAAAEATRSRKQIQDDAVAADRAARDNSRRGRTPSPSPNSAGVSLALEIGPLGVRSVTHQPRPITPEQIARGEARTPQGVGGAGAPTPADQDA